MSRPHRALTCALLLALGACRSTPSPVEAPGNGFLNALVLPAVGPVPYRPRALSGKVVLVSFFATWCFPCVAEVPTLQALQRDHGPAGLQVVAVGMDLEGRRVLGPYADQAALNYPMLLADEYLRSGRSAFGHIGALPMTVLLDRDGRAVSAWQGMSAHGELEKTLRKLLKR
ncbi:Thiol-disulfide isomerase or thioredoxin [Stigmatella aurantiaca]|uniref:Thiol-disulfide isomerase or thioredoxin n=1 Tax=Stigmatella aurantiaca TaxID=41 RepID=A0A1H7K809_STIAU|nr:TlpA disulfide reductase family protein [Stigmatella aurantiaca]SEK82077.1 Thiol-disulfide isomerase or thioredoxin [Stigmatella aurantiaca]